MRPTNQTRWSWRKLTAPFAASVLLLSGCTAADDSGATETAPAATEEQVEISFLTHWGPDQVAQLEEAATKFKEVNPNVTVSIQAVPFGNLLDTVRTQASSPDGPTIAGLYDAWLPELVRDGLAAPAPAQYADDINAGYPTPLAQDVTKEGNVYGYPSEVTLYALNYNARLFEEAGIDGPPETWEEMLAAAEAIEALGGDIQGIGFITSWAAGAVHPFLSLAASNGVTLLAEDGVSTNLGDPRFQEVADLYEQIVADGLTDPDMSTADVNTAGPFFDSFANGKTGMVIMANWWQGGLKSAMGDSYVDVATAPIPVGPSGSVASPTSYSWYTQVNAQATEAQQAAAWEFLAWLNGPDSGANGSSAMGDILMGMGIIPSRTSDVEANAEALADPFLKAYVDMLPDASPFPTVLGGQAATDAIQKQVEALIFGKASAADALATAKAEADAALQKAAGN
jgi:multiple sugar transport system substrate-binding protein